MCSSRLNIGNYGTQRQSVNIKKLIEPYINRKHQEEISYKLAQLPNKLNSAEKEWIDCNDIIQGTAEKMVGQKKSGGQPKKATAWWIEETRQATELKKAIIQEVTERHHRTKNTISQLEMHANKLSNRPKNRHGDQLKDMRKTEAIKSFHKKVKSMRERGQPHCPVTTN